MRRVMLEAPVGDDVFGEDPAVNRLEEYVAALLGKEAALYAPSGTMTNQIGVHVNTNRGEEVLLHEGSHIFVYEAGAPAMLSGDEETIGGGRRTRKAFGGGMRQAGIIAAASLYAFENHVDRLARDHEHASYLASGLREAGYEAKEPETNLVLVAVDDPPEFLQALAREGVLATPGKPGYVRLCTHLDVEEREIEGAIRAAARIAASVIER